MGLARGLVRGTVRGLVRGLVRSQSDPLTAALAYYYSKASDGQTITEQRGLGAPNGTNGPTVAVESSDAYYAPYVAADGAYVNFPGSEDNYVSSVSVLADGDLTIEAFATIDIASGVTQTFYSQRSGADEFHFRINGTGNLVFLRWNSSGSLAINNTSSIAMPVTGVNFIGARVKNIPDNGSSQYVLNFEYTLDGSNWITLGSQFTGTSFTPRSGDSTDGTIGLRKTTGADERLTGNVHSVSLYFDSSAATIVKSFNAASFANGLTYTDPVSGQLVTLNQSTTGRPAFVVDESTFEAAGVDKLLLFPSDPAYGIGVGAEFGYVGRFSIPAAMVNGGFLAATCDSSKNEGWGITVSTAGYLTATIDEGANRDTATGSVSVLGKNSVAVALVVTAATLSVYADGVLHASVARTAGAVPAGLMRVFTSGGVTAGGYQRGGWFGHEVQASAPTIAQQNAIAARLEALNG